MNYETAGLVTIDEDEFKIMMHEKFEKLTHNNYEFHQKLEGYDDEFKYIPRGRDHDYELGVSEYLYELINDLMGSGSYEAGLNFVEGFDECTE